MDTQGDAFFYAFAKATDATAAAREAQAALAGGDVRVRIGMHTGEPVLTDEGYVGIDVHRAARICSAAHGGQTILSAATARLVRPTSETSVSSASKIWMRRCICTSWVRMIFPLCGRSTSATFRSK